MTEKIGVVTDAEWEIMRMVWSLGQVNSSHLIELVQQKRDWQASTDFARSVGKKRLSNCH